MKKIIKNILPNVLLNFYINWRSKKYYFKKKPIDKVFTWIYDNKHWASEESISGPGSEIGQTGSVVNNLNDIIKHFKPEIFLDIPCGDFNWMKNVEFNDVKYIGADIVHQLILENRKKYKHHSNVNFEVLDLTKDKLPKVDIIFCRDCLVHLSFENIRKAIKNIIDSNSEYLITTSFTSHQENVDIVTGQWRPLNFEESPFNFKNQFPVYPEKCTEMNEKYSDKSLVIFKISDLNEF